MLCTASHAVPCGPPPTPPPGITAEGDNRVLFQKVAKELTAATHTPAVRARLAAAQERPPAVTPGVQARRRLQASGQGGAALEGGTRMQAVARGAQDFRQCCLLGTPTLRSTQPASLAC